MICDLRLPGLSGDEVCLTARAGFPDMAMVVAVSGFAPQDTRDRLQELGVPFLAKPFRKRDLREVIDQAIRAPLYPLGGQDARFCRR